MIKLFCKDNFGSQCSWAKRFRQGREDHLPSENIQLIRQVMIYIDKILLDTSLSTIE